jgi:hypothetical protein
MRTIGRLAAPILVCGLAACGTSGLPPGPPVAAAPLASITIPTGTFDKKELIGAVVLDSYDKCGAFVSAMTRSQDSVNTAGDIVSTILTGLATVFTPITTIHALTAASTIVTGTKTAINSDLWAKANIANFSKAIDGTYYNKMADYTTSLTTMDPATITINNEVAKITSIHHMCALAPAEDSISQQLAPPASTVPPVTPPVVQKPAPGPHRSIPVAPGPSGITTGGIPGQRLWQ